MPPSTRRYDTTGAVTEDGDSGADATTSETATGTLTADRSRRSRQRRCSLPKPPPPPAPTTARTNTAPSRSTTAGDWTYTLNNADSAKVQALECRPGPDRQLYLYRHQPGWRRDHPGRSPSPSPARTMPPSTRRYDTTGAVTEDGDSGADATTSETATGTLTADRSRRRRQRRCSLPKPPPPPAPTTARTNTAPSRSTTAGDWTYTLNNADSAKVQALECRPGPDRQLYLYRHQPGWRRDHPGRSPSPSPARTMPPSTRRYDTTGAVTEDGDSGADATTSETATGTLTADRCRRRRQRRCSLPKPPPPPAPTTARTNTAPSRSTTAGDWTYTLNNADSAKVQALECRPGPDRQLYLYRHQPGWRRAPPRRSTITITGADDATVNSPVRYHRSGHRRRATAVRTHAIRAPPSGITDRRRSRHHRSRRCRLAEAAPAAAPTTAADEITAPSRSTRLATGPTP